MYVTLFVFLMIRRTPRSTLVRSSAASDVYKRQVDDGHAVERVAIHSDDVLLGNRCRCAVVVHLVDAVSYTHLRAHETVLDLVCRLLLEKKK